MAICTNNVREWEPLWRAMLPVDEIFDVVVDSAFVGVRKPEAAHLRAHPRSASASTRRRRCSSTTSSSTAPPPANSGLAAVWFRSTEQAIADVEAMLTGGGAADPIASALRPEH